MENNNGLTFDEWQSEVDALIQEELGIGLFDLPDREMYEPWENNVLPEDFANEILVEEIGDYDE